MEFVPKGPEKAILPKAIIGSDNRTKVTNRSA